MPSSYPGGIPGITGGIPGIIGGTPGIIGGIPETEIHFYQLKCVLYVVFICRIIF